MRTAGCVINLSPKQYGIGYALMLVFALTWWKFLGYV